MNYHRFYCFSYGDLNALLPEYCGATEAINGTYITAYELPNGYTAIFSGFFYDGDTLFAGTSIEYFDFTTCPSMTSLETTATGKNWFTGSSIKEVKLGTSFETIPVMMFYNCDSMVEITIPNSVKKIDRLAIYDCAKLKNIYISENSQLETLNSNALNNNPVLEYLYLPSGITTLGIAGSNQSPIQGNKNMYLVNSPNETTKPTVYYLPDTITAVVGEIFKNCQNLNDVIVFNKNITSLSDGWAFNGSNSVTLVFLGDVESLSTSGAAWTKQTAIYFCNKADTGYTGNTNVASKYVYCNAEGNTDHLRNPNADDTTPADCVNPETSFTFCFCKAPMGKQKTGDALGHDYSLEGTPDIAGWNYNGNYYANAKYMHVCTVCMDAYDGDEVENSALFTALGYSSFLDSETEGSFVASTMINNGAMDEFKLTLGEDDVLLYGVYFGVTTEENPIDADGKGNGNVVACSFEGSRYAKIEMRVNGIGSAWFDKDLSCGAYVILNGAVTYLIDGEAKAEATPIIFNNYIEE